MLYCTEHLYRALEADLPPAPYVLLKTGQATAGERWSLLGWDPWLVWAPCGQRHPWSELDRLVTAAREAAEVPTDLDVPVPVLMGALAYDLGRTVETVRATARDPWRGLQAVLYGFRQFIVVDEWARRSWTIRIDPRGAVGSHDAVPASFAIDTLPAANFDRAGFCAAVERLRGHIAAGDCYQVNLSQQFVRELRYPAADAFRRALQHNPAPMMGLIDAGPWQVVSTSPERLVRRRGDRLVTCPIKGTRPRLTDPVTDAVLRESLLTNEKERAELAMIVDLMRNDLGRVAEPGSVVVEAFPRIESYANVHHAVAVIAANAPPAVTWGTLLHALFPGGSITGCPKPMAMQLIEDMEGVRRGVYCGSLGYIDQRADGDWNIAIRTMTCAAGRAVLNLGSGIVFDSDPEAEYEECLVKGKTLFEILT